jgi:hypothetical protein
VPTTHTLQLGYGESQMLYCVYRHTHHVLVCALLQLGYGEAQMLDKLLYEEEVKNSLLLCLPACMPYTQSACVCTFAAGLWWGSDAGEAAVLCVPS